MLTLTIANCGGITIKERSRWLSLIKGDSNTQKDVSKIKKDVVDTQQDAVDTQKGVSNTNTHSSGEDYMILGSSKSDKIDKHGSIDREDFLSPPPAVDMRQASMVSDSRVAPPAAVIGAKIRFIGELVGEEDLLIQGYVEGIINLKGNALVIGKQGVVKANVLAKTVIIEGQIDGDVYGEERISVKSSSKVTGNLIAERVTLEDGAKFKGSIDMDMDARKDDYKSFNQNSALRNSTVSRKVETSKNEPVKDPISLPASAEAK